MNTSNINVGVPYPVVLDGQQIGKLLASEWAKVPDVVFIASGMRVTSMYFDGSQLVVSTKVLAMRRSA